MGRASPSSLKSQTVVLTTWQVFAVVVGSMAAVTALIFTIISIFSQYRTIAMLFAWEWILVILWAAMTGLFEDMYRNETARMQPGVRAMKTAAHFDA